MLYGVYFSQNISEKRSTIIKDGLKTQGIRLAYLNSGTVPVPLLNRNAFLSEDILKRIGWI
jgi:hypothetical protein